MVTAFLRRHELPRGAWDECVKAHEAGWFFHTERWLDYSLAHTPGSSDGSFAGVGATGLIEVVVPLIYHEASQSYVHGGQITPRPLALSTGAKIITAMSFAQALNVSKMPWPTLMVGPVREWDDRENSTPDASFERWRTHVLDLTKTEDALWSGLRKSYRSPIHRAQELYDLRVHGRAQSGPPFDIFVAQDIHRQAAGRVTRSQVTWDMMSQWIQDGDALCAVAWSSMGARGYAYAIRWKSHAYYASGSSLDDDLQAALLWELIRALRQDGRTKTFELGWGARATDDDKARGIAFFKSGFGGEEWHVAAARKTPQGGADGIQQLR